MKKILTIVLLLTLIAFTLISGTMALYTVKIDNFASGSVVAKEFIFTKGGTDTFTDNVKIAPTETKTMSFSVKNFESDTKYSEVPMKVDFTVSIDAADGKELIDPLKFVVKNEDDVNIGDSVTGSGQITFSIELEENTKEEHTFTVEILWQSDDEVDINYAGEGHGSAITVSATATQKVN